MRLSLISLLIKQRYFRTPWAEAALLTHGAKRVITVEYMPINTDYPGLAAFHPSKALTNANKSYTSNAFFIAIFPIP